MATGTPLPRKLLEKIKGEVLLPNQCDVVVVGSGAGGLTAALSARARGLDVLVLEKSAHFGGTSVRSGGSLWIPGNPHQEPAERRNDIDDAFRYIRVCAGENFDPQKTNAYLENGPEMIRFLEHETDLLFSIATGLPDYHPQRAGASLSGRTLHTPFYNGKKLGKDFIRLAYPHPEMTFLGMQIGNKRDYPHFLKVTKSLKSFVYVAGRMARHAQEFVRYGRAASLCGGSSLVAQLAKAVLDVGIPIHTSIQVTSLILDKGAVVGVNAGSHSVSARRGVILATGGFPGDFTRKENVYRHPADSAGHLTVANYANSGDGIKMAEEIGASSIENFANGGAWVPVSVVQRKGGPAIFPHFLDLPKPGRIAVTKDGVRFCNESDSYHHFVESMIKACNKSDTVSAFIVTDHRSFRRYGLGAARPSPLPFKNLVRSGYLLVGETLSELANKAGIPEQALTQTVEEFNIDARVGVDTYFCRGSNKYNTYYGDRRNQPNSCVAPIETGPFYAIRLMPGDFATLHGLKTDAFARVLSSGSEPIRGLYAAGNDAASIFGGDYPGAGATLGPAMTFGYVAGRTI